MPLKSASSPVLPLSTTRRTARAPETFVNHEDCPQHGSFLLTLSHVPFIRERHESPESAPTVSLPLLSAPQTLSFSSFSSSPAVPLSQLPWTLSSSLQAVPTSLVWASILHTVTTMTSSLVSLTLVLLLLTDLQLVFQKYRQTHASSVLG